MTTTGEQGAPAIRGGTVFDIGYQRYEGPREGRNRGRYAVVKNGIRTALALGRGARAKIMPWGFIVILSLIALVMALIAGAVGIYAGERFAEQVPSHADYYGISSIILFVFAAVVAPEMLCRDRREGVINLYLVRPLTGSDYIGARWVAMFSVMVAACWFPQTILFLGRTLGAPVPLDYMRENWLDTPRFLASGVVMAVYVTTLALLVASFTTRRAYAAIFLVGLFVVTTPFTAGMSTEISGPLGQWISMFNLTNIPVYVNDAIFGELSGITSVAPARTLPHSVHVAWYLGWVIIPGTVLWLRYRRLSP